MIEKYDFGLVRVDGEEYRRDVIIYPASAEAPGGKPEEGPAAGGKARVDATWWRKEGHRLDEADLKEVVAAKPEVLVVGTGYYACMEVPRETLEFLKNVGIEVYAERTEVACKKYNELKDIRRVVAALHLTC